MNSQIVLLFAMIAVAVSSPLAEHLDSMSKVTPTPVFISSPRPDLMKLHAAAAPAPMVSSVSIPKSEEVDSAIHTLTTGESAKTAGDLDGANTLIVGVPYGGYLGGFGFPYGGFGFGR